MQKEFMNSIIQRHPNVNMIGTSAREQVNFIFPTEMDTEMPTYQCSLTSLIHFSEFFNGLHVSASGEMKFHYTKCHRGVTSRFFFIYSFILVKIEMKMQCR